VVFPSPFEAFDVYDQRAGLAVGTTRSIIRHSSERGAWAALERGEHSMPEFFEALNAEGAELGHTIDAATIMATIGEKSGARPEMLRAITAVRASGRSVAALTNNWADDRGDSVPSGLKFDEHFDAIVESAKVGLRKPDPRIYELACQRLDASPHECVFLDDLGINLKPAKSMGMATIKVTSADQALDELEDILGHPVR